jgi:hypothetical protein
MMNALEPGEELTTYHPRSFVDLKAFVDLVPALYHMHGNLWSFLMEKDISECILSFLQQEEFDQRLMELQKNTASETTFRKRFFHWFNAFMVMKYVHFARDKHYPNVVVDEVAQYPA